MKNILSRNFIGLICLVIPTSIESAWSHPTEIDLISNIGIGTIFTFQERINIPAKKDRFEIGRKYITAGMGGPAVGYAKCDLVIDRASDRDRYIPAGLETTVIGITLFRAPSEWRTHEFIHNGPPLYRPIWLELQTPDKGLMTISCQYRLNSGYVPIDNDYYTFDGQIKIGCFRQLISPLLKMTWAEPEEIK